jgi:DUF4097 and DUF4098 domain-containing protein YvlB
MKKEGFYYVAAALAAAWIAAPARTAARQNFSIDFPDGAGRCADVRVRSSGQVARAAESFTLAKRETSVLAVSGLENAQIRVRGWDGPDYSVEACKIAAAADSSTANQILKSIAVTRNGSRFSASGPAASGDEWQVVFIVHAPKDASLDLETRNGPIGARDISGALKARATNGPVSIDNCSGTIEAHANNGPISFTGGSGDVRLSTENGPISLKLSGESWNGPALEARTVNGPLSAGLPAAFRSGVRIETDGHAPLSCGLDACRDARTDATGAHRVLQLNGSNATVRLSTTNGPMSVGGGNKRPRAI